MTARKPTDPRPNVAAVKALFDAITGEDGTVEIAHAVTLPGRSVTVHLSAEEVARYLLATGWRETTQEEDTDRYFIRRCSGPTEIDMLRVPRADSGAPPDGAIIAIAEVENRHPLDVADDIIARRKPVKAKRAKRKGGSDGT